jgi:hypothetical protein
VLRLPAVAACRSGRDRIAPERESLRLNSESVWKHGSMADPSEEDAAHCDMGHDLGYVDAGLLFAQEAPPAGHPGEGPLDHPAPGQDLEAGRALDPADNLDGEVEEGGLSKFDRNSAKRLISLGRGGPKCDNTDGVRSVLAGRGCRRGRVAPVWFCSARGSCAFRHEQCVSGCARAGRARFGGWRCGRFADLNLENRLLKKSMIGDGCQRR